MKKWTYLLAGVMSLNVAFANDSILISEMKNMRDAMHTINDGFFYHKQEKILSGLDHLQKANEIFKNHADIKKYLPEKSKHMTGISFNNARKIDMNINSMKQFVSNKKYNQAAAKYTEILNSCTACHAIVRGW